MAVVGSLATIGGMFIPAYEYGFPPEIDDIDWWETFSGIDIALAATCGITVCLSVIALLSGRRAIRPLAAIAAAMTFGLAFSPVLVESFNETEGTLAGLWIVGGTAAIALVGAVLIALSKPD
jgi:hypothetical protein